MPIDTTAPIRSLTGDAMKKGNLTDQFGRVTGPDPTSGDFCIRDAVAEALFQQQEGDATDGSTQLKKYRIANLFFADAVLDELNADDRAYILERSAKLGPLVHGRLTEALENAAQLDRPKPPSGEGPQ